MQSPVTYTSSGNEEIFVDRDGQIFDHILQYLRTGCLPADNISLLEQLKLEAKYYQLAKIEADIELVQIGNHQDEHMFIDARGIHRLECEAADGKNNKFIKFQTIKSYNVSHTTKKCSKNDEHYRQTEGVSCDYEQVIDGVEPKVEFLARKYN